MSAFVVMRTLRKKNRPCFEGQVHSSRVNYLEGMPALDPKAQKGLHERTYLHRFAPATPTCTIRALSTPATSILFIFRNPSNDPRGIGSYSVSGVIFFDW